MTSFTDQSQLFPEDFNGDRVKDDREKVSRGDGGEEPAVHVPVMGHFTSNTFIVIEMIDLRWHFFI